MRFYTISTHCAAAMSRVIRRAGASSNISTRLGTWFDFYWACPSSSFCIRRSSSRIPSVTFPPELRICGGFCSRRPLLLVSGHDHDCMKLENATHHILAGFNEIDQLLAYPMLVVNRWSNHGGVCQLAWNPRGPFPSQNMSQSCLSVSPRPPSFMVISLTWHKFTVVFAIIKIGEANVAKESNRCLFSKISARLLMSNWWVNFFPW